MAGCVCSRGDDGKSKPPDRQAGRWHKYLHGEKRFYCAMHMMQAREEAKDVMAGRQLLLQLTQLTTRRGGAGGMHSMFERIANA
jgi:hypothetical protein